MMDYMEVVVEHVNLVGVFDKLVVLVDICYQLVVVGIQLVFDSC